MFWRFNYTTSPLHTLLDKEDVTLKEIMDEEDVLQECKSNNEKLINFLIKPEIMNELVENTISLPSEDLNEKERFKYSTISCELLTSDISTIYDALIENETIMDKLYSFLINNDQQTVNPLMASYFAKVIGSLISRKTDSFLNYIQKKDDFLKNFLKNINTSAITDILLRLLTTIDSNELRNKIIKWLKDINLINGLVELFKHENTNEIHSNTSQILCDLIRISRDQILTQRETSNECFMSTNNLNINTNSNSSSNDAEQQRDQTQISIEVLHKNSLLDEIESEEKLEKLLNLIIDSVDKPNSSLVYGIEIFLTIFEPASWSNELELNESQQNFEEEKLKREKERIEISMYGIKSAKGCCLHRLSDIHNLLVNLKSKIENYNLSNGSQVPLLGTSRLAIIKLISKLICLNDENINQELIKLGTINQILDMMFVYKWNNFLHFQLKDIISNCFISDFKKITSLSNSNLNKNQQDVEMTNENETKEKEIENSNKINEITNLDQIIKNVKVEDLEAGDQNKKTFLRHFFKECNLVHKLVHAWSEYFSGIEDITDKKIILSKPNSVGYIGHLTVLSNLIYKNSKEGKYSEYVQDCLDKFVEKDILETWNDLNENKINKLNSLNSKDLVRNPFLTSSVSTSDTTDFIDLPSDERMNKKFSDLQKEMKINCVEDFSISESQIVNFNSKATGSFTKTKNISFAIDANDESAQIFEQVCLQRDNMNLSTSVGNSCMLEEDVWVAKEIKFSDNTNTTNNNNTTENWATFSSDKEFKLKSETKNFNDSMGKHTSIKKYSEKLALTNYSSSSSSESSSSSSSDDDEENDAVSESRLNLDPNRNRNKRHHRQNQYNHSHKESKYKETKEEISDFFKDDDPFKTESKPTQDKPEEIKQAIDENWANFEQFLSQDANQNTNKNIEDTLEDPWKSTNQQTETKVEPKEEQQNWANFDNFN